MTRGEIWWADLGVPFGSEPGFRRPVPVVQADSFNRSRIGKGGSIEPESLRDVEAGIRLVLAL